MSNKENPKTCFVISPIGEEGSTTRERSDQVLKHIITEAVNPLGYEVIRADKISEPGIITTQIIEHIVNAELVIADLTEKNPNVFYELAIRHAIRKPLVQMIKKGEIIPFDVAATRIIQFDIHNLDSVAEAKQEIISQVKSLATTNAKIHNPISVSLDLKILKESGNIEERSFADVVEAISDLRRTITSPDKSISSSKVFEELKTLLDNFSSKIDERLDSATIRRKRRMFHPMMLEEMIHVDMQENEPNIGFLIAISYLKDDFPWLYEIGLETYRELKSFKTKPEKRKLIERFNRMLEMLDRPILREHYGKSEEMYMFSKNIHYIIHDYIDKYLSDTK
ncbi:hypothetical protein A9P82_05760 [Arachidicoccus ginsenosidimutans]|uniref:hypothetical protein n=1 Tax=Arachidicoccus sp. BS20 TaxID=1850526 RepID=UPI0007F15827|nr:hypothetical protein [Arachidicoccus sp. BS20]ANI88837.1 hypothetical protein A9P82_05760 [Arachidicoccus sp. BS20]